MGPRPTVTMASLADSGSPRSPGSPGVSPRSSQFSIDKLQDQIASLKFRHDNLQEEANHLKDQIDEGGSRHGRIKTVEKMVIESRRQIQEMMEENERLVDLLDGVTEERDDGFRTRDERIAELLALAGESQEQKRLNELKKSQLQNLLESNAQMESELDGWRAELEKLRLDKDRLRELLNAYISMRQDLRNLLTLKKQVDSLVKVEVDS